jgi:membrane protein
MSRLPGSAVGAVLKRAASEARQDNITDWAASLTYYAVLSLFPAAIVLTSLLGMLGDSRVSVTSMLEFVEDVAPEQAVSTVQGPLESVVNSQGHGALLSVGLLFALWSASGYVSAFGRALNAIYEVEEGRPFWKLRPWQVGLTLFALICVGLVAAMLVLSGPVARAVGDAVGLGDAAVTVWDWVKWPLVLLIVVALLAVMYWASPNVKHPKFRWLTVGSCVAIVVWIIVSVGFAVYVANFGKYNATYGTLGAVVVFLIWTWLSNLALLFGAEVDAEAERVRELHAGLPAEETLQLAPRG